MYNNGYEAYNEGQVFVGMQFRGMDDIYEVIKTACQENNLTTKRVDEMANSNNIIGDIVKLIEESEFIILDLTHSNPNVYYELGYTDGVGNEPKEILLLAQDATELHFDVRHRRVLFYKDAYALQELLKIKLPQFIEDGRK
jgi:hypothetical protein